MEGGPGDSVKCGTRDSVRGKTGDSFMGETLHAVKGGSRGLGLRRAKGD